MRTVTFIAVLTLGMAIGLAIGLLWPRWHGMPGYNERLVGTPASQEMSKQSPWAGWQFTNSAVAVDPVSEWLRIPSDGKNSDRAFKNVSLDLPVILESRVRLAHGGRNYTLPWVYVFCGTVEGSGGRINCGSASQGLRSQWFIFLDSPDWPETLSTAVSAKPSRGENVWVTIRAVIEKEKGYLYAKHDDESDFSLVAEQHWPAIDTHVKRIAIEQPWDAECDIERVTISERKNGGTN